MKSRSELIKLLARAHRIEWKNSRSSAMGRKSVLSEYERGLIDGLKASGHSNRSIAKLINRSKTPIDNYLNDKENYGQNYHKCGRKQVTTAREKKAFLKELLNGKSIMESKAENRLSASKTTLWNVTQNAKHVKYIKLRSAPKLTVKHIEDRLRWAKDHMSYGADWNNVIFSDEKKFNLDGPDGYKYYWSDLRTNNKYYSKCPFGGGSLMVWAAIGYNGKSEIVIIDKRMKSEDYEEVLTKYLLPYIERIGGPNYIFQQDNCKIHTSKHMKDWFKAKNIKLLDWPSLSPDLNIIENCWGELVRRVYGHNRQFSSVQELKATVLEEWEQLEQQYIRKLFHSMDNRLFELISKNGHKINY